MAARRKKVSGDWLLPDVFSDYPDRLSKYLDKLFFAPARYLEGFAELPDVDLIDEGDHFVIRADMPGVRKEDIKLRVDKDKVVISAETKKQKEEKGKNYYYNERSAASYFRSIPLPSEVLPDTASAKFEDGTLEINVKKTKEEGKEIEVK